MDGMGVENHRVTSRSSRTIYEKIRGNKRKSQGLADKVNAFNLTFLKFMPNPEDILALSLQDSSKRTKRQYRWKGRPYLIGLKHAIVLLCDHPTLQDELTAHLQELY